MAAKILTQLSLLSLAAVLSWPLLPFAYPWVSGSDYITQEPGTSANVFRRDGLEPNETGIWVALDNIPIPLTCMMNTANNACPPLNYGYYDLEYGQYYIGCSSLQNCTTETGCDYYNGQIPLTNQTCVCDGQKESCYETSCSLVWQRIYYLTWLDTTCSGVPNWTGLPQNWEERLSVLTADVMLWSSNMTISQSSDRIGSIKCPSSASNLGAFVAVNLGIVIVILILGRRDTIRWLSHGRLGKQDSTFWYITAAFAVLMHIGSNTIAASITKRTPGFEGAKFWDLVLLWCTRPRVAWMTTALTPFHAEESLYFSVAASSLCSELVMQLIGAKVMGSATNFARKQKFYKSNLLSSSPNGDIRMATMMFAGSLMWLLFLIVALITGYYTLLYLVEVRSQIKIIDATKRFQEQTKPRIEECLTEAGFWSRSNSHEVPLQSQEAVLLRSAWAQLADRWASLKDNSNVSEHATLFEVPGTFPRLRATDPQRLQTLLQLLEPFEEQLEVKNSQEEALRYVISTKEQPRYSDRNYDDILSHIQEGNTSLTLQIREQLLPVSDELRAQFWRWREEPFDWRKIGKQCLELEELEDQTGDLKLLRTSTFDDLLKKKGKNYFKRLAIMPVMGMFLCWFSQWLFWIGYVLAAGDWYCPTKLPTIAGIWFLFSAISVIVGASF